MATSVLNTTPPNWPMVALPKSRATVFDEATTLGSRATKYATLAERKSTRTIDIEE
jgi:hypothetical protein